MNTWTKTPPGSPAVEVLRIDQDARPPRYVGIAELDGWNTSGQPAKVYRIIEQTHGGPWIARVPTMDCPDLATAKLLAEPRP